MSTRLVYKRKDGKWAWSLTADNGKIIAVDGSQGYDDEDECRRMADRVVGGLYSDATKKVRRQA